MLKLAGSLSYLGTLAHVCFNRAESFSDEILDAKPVIPMSGYPPGRIERVLLPAIIRDPTPLFLILD